MMTSPIRADIQALKAYPVPPSAGLVKLDAMENPYLLPEEVRQALAERLSQQALNRYPDAHHEALKSCLREAMGIQAGTDLLLGNGSDELIQMIAMAVNGPGAVVMGVDPSFVMFRMIATFLGMRYVGVPLREDFSLNGPDLLASIEAHQPAVIFLAYPNNPTGNLFDPVVMREVLRAAPGLVVVDEAYFPFTDHSFLGELDRHPRLLVMRTLSKLGLAGARLGFLAGDPELVVHLDKVRLPYNLSVLDQVAVLEVMTRYRNVLQSQVLHLREDRLRLADAMRGMAGVEVFPSEANFLLFRVAAAGRVFDGLLQHGILVRNLSAAHSLLDNCLRVTVGTPEENRRFLEALERVLPQTTVDSAP